MNNQYNNQNNMNQPVNNTYQPMNNVNQPVNNMYQPMNNMNQPVNNTYQPMNNVNQPVNNMYQPMNNMNQPVNNTYQPMNNMNQPMNNMNMNGNMIMGGNQPKKTNNALIIIIIITIIAVVLGIVLLGKDDSKDAKKDNETKEESKKEDKDDDYNYDEDYDYDDDYDYDYDYSDKNEELFKNIETKVEIAKDGTFIVFAKNNNKKTVEIEIDVEFFDASGKSIDDDYIISFGLGANSELADEIYAPETYSTYKITVDAEEADNDSLYDKVSYTHKQTNNNVVVTVKNNADKTIEDIDMTIVFYDGDKALSMDYDYIYDLTAGQAEDITFYAPYDYNAHQYFKYTSYKVYLNDAYNW